MPFPRLAKAAKEIARESTKAAKARKPMGRPSVMTPELQHEICRRLSLGETLQSICDSDGMPAQDAVFRCLRRDDEFRDLYAQAREDQAEHDADEQVAIADRSTVRSWKPDRLKIDARRWRASVMHPKKYGARLDVAASLTARVVFDCDYGQPGQPLPLLAPGQAAALPRRPVEVEDARIVETVPAAAVPEPAEPASPAKGRYRGQLL